MQKINLDLSPEKITVGQYVGFAINEGDLVNQVQSITKLPRSKVLLLTPSQMNDIKNSFDEALLAIPSKHVPKFMTKFTKYRFVPDINSMTFGEWLDLDANCNEFPKHLNKLLAILFRPCKNEFINRYEVEDYDSTIHLKNAEDFNEMPLMIANGAMVFFSNIEKELLIRFQEFSDNQMMTELKKAIAMMQEALQQPAS
jgi:hypothetical protein